MLDIRHLRVLQAVARTGSFSGAARELNLTQPAVSQQIRALEKAVDTPVVVRAGRRMDLTEAGAVLVRHAVTILDGLAAAEEEVAALAGLRSGRVRLAAFPSASSTLVPPAVAAVRAAHPGVRLSLVEAEPPESVEMLREGDCEVALAFRYPGAEYGGAEYGGAEYAGAEYAAPGHRDAGHPGTGPEPAGRRAGGSGWDGLTEVPLLTDRLVGLLPSAHPLLAATRGERPVRLAELAEEPWIAGCPQCRGNLVEECARQGFAPRIEFATDDSPAVVGLVAAGLGVAVLPALALGAVRGAGVEVVELGPPLRREVVALTVPDLARVPSVRAALDELVRAARTLVSPVAP
ncbi:LysR family transcriptional regulator [Allostreptomyces psammosilenae]|uniref:Molybdate transport repressor ModE-like protein n=1 Tax=Allostreptomyces psammosilenae TaxID=1892865 RepID=A0A852ZUJ7_9ACTN|nr:LysR family transcriptional regulator [Allostreptomyces psammosilenae]NYI05959.1 molybdate transport repressor ModE-like protein [Allostreptomyces psammosilenae]